MEIEYRKARCTDAGQVHRVETICFPTPWSLHSIMYDLCDNPITYYVVALDAQKVVGFCGVHLIVGEGHITNVAVLPEYRGNGIGRAMLEMLFAQTGHVAAQYTLEVRPSNQAAIQLYTKLGFQTLGRRPKYYSDNGEDALIMWRNNVVIY